MSCESFFSFSEISQFYLFNLHSIIAALHLTAFQLSFLRLSFQPHGNTEPCTLFLPLSICLALSLSLSLFFLKARTWSRSLSLKIKQHIKKKEAELDSEHLFTLDLVGWAQSTRYWTGLSFSLSDRDNPLSGATSGFLQCPWLSFQKAS